MAGLICFLTLAAAASPGLTGGDAGELIAVSRSLSTAHPPGYPLYVWLGWLASHLLWGSPAHRFNLFSALCGAVSAGLFAAAVNRWTRAPVLSAAGALAFAWSPLMLTWSTRAEVFALDQAMAALVVYLAVRFLDAPSRGGAATLGLALGAGLGNHQTLVLLGVPVVAAAMAGTSRANWLAALAGLAGGLGVYLLVPLGTWLGPEQAWGEALTLDGFLGHVLRRDYGTLRLAAESAGAPSPLSSVLLAFGHSQLEQLGFAGAPLALWGLGSNVRHRRLALALGLAWMLSGPAFLALARFPMTTPLMSTVLERFWLLPALAALLLAALGLSALVRQPRAAAVVASLVVFASFARAAWQLRDAPAGSLAEGYAAELFDELPEHAVLLVRGDLLSNAARYAQSTGRRPDLEVLDQELLTRGWYVRRHTRAGGVSFPAERWHPGERGGFTLAEMLAHNPTRAFYVAGSLKPGDPSALRRAPNGLSERVTLEELPDAFLRGAEVDAQLVHSAFAQAARAPGTDPWDLALVEERWEASHRLAVSELTKAIATGDLALLADSARRLWALIEAHPSPPAQYFRNAAIAEAHRADAVRLRLALERYLALAPPDAPDLASFRAELARLQASAP